jgi:DNA repair photolyase
MLTTTRKSLLYKTGVEYGDYTANHIEGCAHGCKYPCYAMLMARRFGRAASYEDWTQPKLVSNALDLLDRELPRLQSRINFVQLCFTTDPFMYGYPEINEMTLRVIERINRAGIKVTALTKGLLPHELTETSPDNEFGITLVSLDEDFRKKYEPGAASFSDRIANLRLLHNKGFKTWVSIEPYPTPNILTQDLKIVLRRVAFADKIIFGRLNYNRLVTQYPDYLAFYNQMAQLVSDYCEKHGQEYHVKRGTWGDAHTRQPAGQDGDSIRLLYDQVGPRLAVTRLGTNQG